MIKRIFTTFGFLFLLNFLSAQDTQHIYDSLVSILGKAKSDTQKITIIKEIAYNTAWDKPERALQHTRYGLKLSRKLLNKKWEARMLFSQGYCFYEMRDYKQTLTYYLKACELWKMLNDKPALSECYSNIGIVYWKTTKLDQAKIYYDSAIKINQAIHDTAAMIRCMNNMAMVYKNEGKYPQAIKYYLQVLDYHIYKKNNVKVANVSLNIGVLQLEMMNYKDAEENFFRALYLYTKEKNEKSVLETRANLGMLYSRQSKAEKALEQLKIVYAGLNKYPDKELEGVVVQNMGATYKIQKNYSEAIRYFRKSLALNTSIMRAEGVYDANFGIMDCFLQLGKYDSVQVYVEKDKILMDSIHLMRDQRLSHQFLASYYERKKDLPNALYHMKEYTRINDSLFNVNKDNQVLELSKKYETEKKQHRIDLLEQTQIAKDLTISRNQWLIAALIIIALFITLGAVTYFQYVRKRNAEAEAQLKHKLLRSQLNPHFIFNSLNAVSNCVLENRNQDAALLLNGFTQLMRSILESSKLELISLKEETDLLEKYILLQSVRMNHSFDFLIEITNIENSDNIVLPPMLGQPFVENAIEHAFRNIPSKGVLKITISAETDSLLYEISDNGPGLSDGLEEDKRNHIPRALEITKERLKLLSRQTKKNAEITFVNKRDADPETTGLLVRISLPLLLEN